MRPWHLGNTTVRSPFRLRDGLVALASSPLQGHLRGQENDKAFRELLGAQGIVELGDDKTNSVGRKWRSALSKLGFLYPKVPKLPEFEQGDLGAIDAITPNGLRLISAQTVPAMQECFLRALAAYYIPSVVDKDGYGFAAFSPLRHILSIMLTLEKETGDSRLNFIEMALIAQLTSGDNDLNETIASIIELRKRRDKSINKKKFDRECRQAAADSHGYVEGTFSDYADANFRYLKATGLVQNKGRSLTLMLEKRVFIEQLIATELPPKSDRDYFNMLCEGAALPTDDKAAATLVLQDLLQQLKARGIPFSTKGKPCKTPADIAVVRHEIEALLSAQNEERYASSQVTEWHEIVAYMNLLISRKPRANLANGDEIEIPRTEAPAYFEWVMWRAFLAINSLVNKPFEARRFKIDQDFLPIGTAAGGGPDLIVEFADFVIAVEATLTENSRQEAAEGEPVRRHVADLVMRHSGKAVYGLFVANRVDSNTAETFRIGVWYGQDDKKMRLNIVPFTLGQFKDFFVAVFESNRVAPQHFRNLLDSCGELRRDHEAPEWKLEIAKTVSIAIEKIRG